MRNGEAWWARLVRHTARRAQGIPTVTLLLGDSEGAASRVCDALSEAGTFVVMSREQQVAPMVRDLLRGLYEHHDVPHLAFERVAEALLEPPPSVQSAWAVRSPRERQLWLAHLASEPHCQPALGALRWLEPLSSSEHSSLLARARQAISSMEPKGVLSALMEFVPPERWPLLCAERATNAALDALAAIAQLAPRLPVAAICTEAESRALAARAQSRTKALLLEGLVRLEAPPIAKAERRTEAALTSLEGGESASRSAGVPEHVARLHAEAQSLLNAARAARSTKSPDSGECNERARSLAERLLYERLRAERATAEVFELNGQMAFRFGPRPAEIDLVARSLHLAVEIDGYHHFKDSDAYRRDRRKDILLQAQGFWVLRYLATDVVEDIDGVVERICDWVSQRRQALRREEGT